MNEINQRISVVIKELKITKTAFAAKLNVSQALISKICAGTSGASDRTIQDICNKFHVSEDWLRFGEGEMFLQRTRAEELDTFFGEIGEGPNNFRKRLISVLAKLDEEDWKLLEEMAWKLVEEIKEPDQES